MALTTETDAIVSGIGPLPFLDTSSEVADVMAAASSVRITGGAHRIA